MKNLYFLVIYILLTSCLSPDNGPEIKYTIYPNPCTGLFVLYIQDSLAPVATINLYGSKNFTYTIPVRKNTQKTIQIDISDIKKSERFIGEIIMGNKSSKFDLYYVKEK